MSQSCTVLLLLVFLGVCCGLSVRDERKETESSPLLRDFNNEETSKILRGSLKEASRNQRSSMDGLSRHHTRGFFDGVVSTLKNFWMNNKETISDLAKYGILAGRHLSDNIKEMNDQ